MSGGENQFRAINQSEAKEQRGGDSRGPHGVDDAHDSVANVLGMAAFSDGLAPSLLALQRSDFNRWIWRKRFLSCLMTSSQSPYLTLRRAEMHAYPYTPRHLSSFRAL